MRTVQMTLEEDLVRSVDQAAKLLHTTRSAFTRTALQEELQRLKMRQAEERHRQGYQKKPVGKDEFSAWHSEQSWGD